MQLACMFPGQGSQFAGMLSELYAQYAIIRDTFAVAKHVLGKDYWEMVSQGPESAINETVNTQVLMLIADTAMYRLLRQEGMPLPKVLAGHSLGEYPALVAAEAIRYEDALKLVQIRAELMQTVHGAMAAIIGLEDAVVTEICAKIVDEYPAKILAPANYNAPGQVVIAGDADLVQASLAHFETAGARMTKILAVSAPCHCELMRPAAKSFYQAILATPIQMPTIPVVANVDAAFYTSVGQIQTLLAEQLYRPVLWTQVLTKLAAAEIDILMECGPGKVLSGLAKRTIPHIKPLACQEPSQLPHWEQD